MAIVAEVLRVCVDCPQVKSQGPASVIAFTISAYGVAHQDHLSPQVAQSRPYIDEAASITSYDKMLFGVYRTWLGSGITFLCILKQSTTYILISRLTLRLQ